jgi:hypothetical protein
MKAESEHGPPSAAAELQESVARLVARQSGVPRERITPATRLREDLHLDGDDVHEIVEEVAATFGVNLANYRGYHHADPEGCNPFGLLFPPWWTHKTRVPIRLADLAEAARTGAWAIEYPEAEREA